MVKNPFPAQKEDLCLKGRYFNGKHLLPVPAEVFGEGQEIVGVPVGPGEEREPAQAGVAQYLPVAGSRLLRIDKSLYL